MLYINSSSEHLLH